MPYIDIDKLCELVEYSKYHNPHSGELRFNHRTEHDHFFQMIMSVPIEDVAKVVHGRWIEVNKRKDPEGWIECDYKCSMCEEISWEEGNYCPWCGAKMDLEDCKCFSTL